MISGVNDYNKYYTLAKQVVDEKHDLQNTPYFQNDMDIVRSIGFAQIGRLEILMHMTSEAESTIKQAEESLLNLCVQAYSDVDSVEEFRAKLKRSASESNLIAKTELFQLFSGALDPDEIIAPTLNVAEAYIDLRKKQKAKQMLQLVFDFKNKESYWIAKYENELNRELDRVAARLIEFKQEPRPVSFEPISISNLSYIGMPIEGGAEAIPLYNLLVRAGTSITERKNILEKVFEIDKNQTGHLEERLTMECKIALALAYLGDIESSKVKAQKIQETLSKKDFNRRNYNCDETSLSNALILQGKVREGIEISDNDLQIRSNAIRYYVRKAAKLYQSTSH